MKFRLEVSVWSTKFVFFAFYHPKGYWKWTWIYAKTCVWFLLKVNYKISSIIFIHTTFNSETHNSDYSFSTSKCTYMCVKLHRYTGWSTKNTPQIIFGNFEKWTARMKIRNDSESRRLIVKHIKNQIVRKSINGKNEGLLNTSCEVSTQVFQ